jgi:hypothetical protein
MSSILKPRPGDRVRRPLRNGLPGEHWGVYVETYWGDGVVFEQTKDAGLRLTPREEFSGGAELTVDPTPDAELSNILPRMMAVAARPAPYDLFTNNCEHIAREVTEGKKYSPQSRFLVGCVVVAAVCLAARNK